MNSIRRSSILPVILLAALAGAGAGCGDGRPAADGVDPRVVVRVAPIEWSTEPTPIRATGTLARKDETQLSFKTDGVVESVLVRAGDRVEKGQVLARLRLDEMDARVAQARASVDKARRDLERAERLLEQSVATLETVQDARTALDVAEAQLRIAEFNRRYSVITAPDRGMILRRAIEPEEFATSGRAAFGFAGMDARWLVRVGLAERDVTRVELGHRARVADVEGRVTQIAGAADRVSRTVEVEIELDAPPAGARSGSVVPVQLRTTDVPRRPAVPASALLEGSGGRAFVFILPQGGEVAKRFEVQVEALDGPIAYLHTPLPAEHLIVASGGEYLRDNAKVTVRP